MTDATEPINPIFAQGDAQGVVHAGEAPPAGYAFYPVAHCGAVMTGDRLENRPPVDDLCATDAKWLGITKTPETTPAKETSKPAPVQEAKD